MNWAQNRLKELNFSKGGGDMTEKKNFRNFQLLCMAFVAFFIAPVVIADTMLIHSLPFPTSISETATIYQRTDSLLPYSLGALSLFALSYALVYSHTFIWDKVFPLGMAIGFTMVAFQPCVSPYLIQDHIGVFGLSHFWSNVIHYAGALVGFGSFIGWITICFMRSDKAKSEQTPEKKIRNNIYTTLGILMISCLSLFPLYLIGWLDDSFAIVMWIEIGMLSFGSIACAVKSGLMFKDT